MANEMAPKSTGVFLVLFKRTEASGWERGIAINEHCSDSGDVTIIIDRDRKPVMEAIWDFRAQLWEGCINFML